MSLTEAQFMVHAREQIRIADVTLARHYEQGSICSCGRVLPCPVEFSIAQRRHHFVTRLARVAASTTATATSRAPP